MGRTGSIGRGLLIGTGLSAAGAVGLLGVQVLAAKARQYARPAIGPGMRATFGHAEAPPVRLVLLGDSSAAGVGVNRVEDSVGGRLAELLAGTGRRVELSSVAVSGSRSADLYTQVARALLGVRPDVAVVLVGTNDATHLVRPRDASAHLVEAVHRLRAAGVAVVVGTCPDLGAVRSIGRPLREIVGWLGRRVAAAQGTGLRETDAMPVDLAARTGAVFRADAGTLCPDRFHPSQDGYRIWAHALYPAVLTAARSVRAG